MAMAADWFGPVGQIVSDLTEEVHQSAIAMAPASATGSKYAPSGYLKSRVSQAHAENAYGVLGLVGVPLRAGSRYPYQFIHSASGFRRVRNQWSKPGTVYKVMGAENMFLYNALTAVSMFGV